MKKVFALEDLDCAHCAKKMEEAIARLEGVTHVSVNFLAQKLTLEAADERFDAVVKEAVAVCKTIEPDCVVLGK